MSAVIRIIILVFIFTGCVNTQQSNFNEALELFRQNKLEQALPLLEEEIVQHEDNAEAYVWLAEIYRRLEMNEKAIETAEKALALDSCNSFAHVVIGESYRRCHWRPRSDSDSNWVHLNRAIQCDSTDGNAWISIWGEAILREKFDLMHKTIRKMKETDFLTKAALSYGRWMLRTLPDSAILITNGDMDTYPLLAVQETEGFRNDVVVAERGLLGTGQYLRFMKDIYGIPLPYTVSQLDSILSQDEHRDDIYLTSYACKRFPYPSDCTGCYCR
jgi:tetratricopeptide (TPR) repeat protein